MNSSSVSGNHLYLALRAQGKVFVDVQALEDSILNGEAGSSLYQLMAILPGARIIAA